jgi:bifunctional DNA-binding transcriptional regulator/antitoxin component of YhaV-PrlF toxin-antitoxin module
MEEEIIVGKKGEILPKKSLREVASISPGDHVLVEAEPNQLVIKRILSVKELMNLPRIASQPAAAIEAELDAEAKRMEDK